MVRGKVLVIAGSDSGGGAGVQADIKSILAHGAFATTAVTALTAQNTTGVHGIHAAPLEFIERQIEIVVRDLPPDGEDGHAGDGGDDSWRLRRSSVMDCETWSWTR